MDYDLDSLGARNFEHIVQALALKTIGSTVRVFGDGRDGGREAAWDGEANSLGRLDSWSGYGVIQAKFRQFTGTPADNLAWLKSAVSRELSDWAKPDSNRARKPDFFLLATNVRLSAVPGSGKDAIDDYVASLIRQLELPIADFRVWDYADIVALLDDAESIRRRYIAFLTPGDLVARLLDADSWGTEFPVLMRSFVARSLHDERFVNLTQGGSVSDEPVTIADVFVDLPADTSGGADPLGSFFGAESRDVDEVEMGKEADFDTAPDIIFEDHSPLEIANYLIGRCDESEPGNEAAQPTARAVLVGGPGQGKSTVTQWLAQMYRVEFLRGSSIASDPDTASVLAKQTESRLRLSIPQIGARRWPFRMALTELADYLHSNQAGSVLQYMAARIAMRTGMDCRPEDLRKWLASYPWVMFFDGLDEVPVSSNRHQVMSSIKDFFIDVATVGGDVAAVATTRPQGYTEEFSPAEYEHLMMRSLSTDQALAYGRGLIATRNGAGTLNAAKVEARLVQASKEDQTARLLESPLQVTILTVLLEKLGKAPSDRSRLFSNYYAVISQREQEKGGPLGELLQKHESDVHYLHRRIGYLLQERASEVGETTSELSQEEFDSILAERLQEQGHAAGEVRRLAQEFSTLITQRLVFLAKIQDERFGFELRSLQEFMASEWILNRPEGEIFAELNDIVGSPYWRNVVLFAIGTIFNTKDHLRAEVVVLCEALNARTATSQIRLPGSDLALEILLDGSTSAAPRYGNALAQTALRVLDTPRPGKKWRIEKMASTDASDAIWSELSSATAGSSGLVNRIMVLGNLVPTHHRAHQILRRQVARATRSELAAVILQALEYNNEAVAREVEANVMLACEPNDFFVHGRRSAALRHVDTKQPDGTWMDVINRLCEFAPVSRADAEDRLSTDSVLVGSLNRLGENSAEWQWVLDNDSSHEWVATTAIAHFSLNPSKETLASALEAIADDPNHAFPDAIPWPILACIHSNSRTHLERGFTLASGLRAIAASVREGEMGDASDWRRLESGLPSRTGVTLDFFTRLLERLAEDQSRTPPGLEPIDGYRFSMMGPISARSRAYITSAIEMAEADVGARSALPFYMGDAFTRAHFVYAPDDDDKKLLADLVDLLRARAEVRPEAASPWASWLDFLLGGAERRSKEELATAVDSNRTLLMALGSSTILHGSLSSEVAITIGEQSAGSYECLRLAIALCPAVWSRFMDAEPVSDSFADEVSRWHSLRALAGYSNEEIESGVHDEVILDLFTTGDGIFGANWVRSAIHGSERRALMEVANRACLLAYRSNLLIAQKIYAILSEAIS